MIHLILSFKQINTCLTVVSSVTSLTITAIASLEVDTCGSVLTWTIGALVYICLKNKNKQKIIDRLQLPQKYFWTDFKYKFCFTSVTRTKRNILAMKCIQVYLIRNCFPYIHFYNHNDDLPED